jgi:pimeloyl-ACP methyl ester carboxylesterase
MTYVLVHGAWHGGWVWRDVVPILRAKGHAVTTPTLTGLGERKHLSADYVGLGTHITDLVNHVEMEGLDRFVLVGWSYGGMVTTGALPQLKDHIQAMVYLDAFVPDHGKALIDYAQRRIEPGHNVAPIPLEVFGVHDPNVAAYVSPRLVLQPWRTFTEAAPSFKERPKDIPHTYVWCTGYAPSPCAKFYDRFKDDPVFEVHTLNTGHQCMLTMPQETAALILGATSNS